MTYPFHVAVRVTLPLEMKLLFTISVAIVLRSNARDYCGTTDGELTDDCIDASGCQPYASKPTVCCAFEIDGHKCGGEGQERCVEYRNDGKHCKQEKVHPIPRCQDIYTQDDISHAEEKWFFCAAGSEDRSLDTATDVGKCMPPESVHGEVCVNWLQWAFMQAVEAPGETCFVNGLESDKDCVMGIAAEVAKTSYEVKVESGSSTFQVRCAESQYYDPQDFMSPTPTGSRPKACGNTFYLKLEDSRVNNFLDEYLYCADSAHQWRSTPYTGAPTNAPTHEPTQEPTNSPTQEPTHEPTQEPTDCGIGMQGVPTFEGTGSTCSEGGYVKQQVCVMGRNAHDVCECTDEYYYQDTEDLCCVDGQPNHRYTFDPYIALDCGGGNNQGGDDDRDECPTYVTTGVDVPQNFCKDRCNRADVNISVLDWCQQDGTCECPKKFKNAQGEIISIQRSIPCTDFAGPEITVTATRDTPDTTCSATCWANEVDNSNVPSNVKKPMKPVDIGLEYCDGVWKQTTDTKRVPCNTYSCAKLLANDAGLAVNN